MGHGSGILPASLILQQRVNREQLLHGRDQFQSGVRGLEAKGRAFSEQLERCRAMMEELEAAGIEF